MKGLGLGLGLTRRSNGGGTPPDPDAEAYLAAILLSGDTYTDTEAGAVNALVPGLKEDGLWAKRLRLAPMIGSGLDAVAVVLDATVGAAADTLNNFVSGDWNRASGLQGNGTSAYIDTGWPPDYGVHLDAAIAFTYRGASLTSPPANVTVWGAVSAAGSSQARFQVQPGTPRIISCFGGDGNTANGILYAATLSSGVWVFNQVEPNATLDLDGVEVSARTFAHSPTNPGRNLTFMANNLNGVINNFMSAGTRLAGYMIFEGLTPSERVALAARIATFNTAIGR